MILGVKNSNISNLKTSKKLTTFGAKIQILEILKIDDFRLQKFKYFEVESIEIPKLTIFLRKNTNIQSFVKIEFSDKNQIL